MFVQIHYASIDGDNEPCCWWCQTAYGKYCGPTEFTNLVSLCKKYVDHPLSVFYSM